MRTRLPNTQHEIYTKQSYYSTQKIISKLKKSLNELTIKQWHFEWDYGDKGRLTHDYFQTVDKNRLTSCKLLSQIYPRDGKFPVYRHQWCTGGGTRTDGVPLLFHFIANIPLLFYFQGDAREGNGKSPTFQTLYFLRGKH